MTGGRAWNFQDLAGRRFNRLVVAGFAGKAGPHLMWVCVCDCGKEVSVAAGNLRSGNTSSCGCLHMERLVSDHLTHGYSKTAEYARYIGMLRRCSTPGEKYFERGVRVCERWIRGENGISGLQCFLDDMGRCPSAKHSIERLKNDEGYSPSNCVWATRAVQNRNTSRNVYVVHEGERLVVADLARKFGLPANTLGGRLKAGWSIERAVATPSRGRL